MAALGPGVTPAWAHVSEGGLILLLPTGVYITSGVAAVVLTILALLLLPRGVTGALFASLRLPLSAIEGLRTATRLLALALLLALVAAGFLGTRDPLENPLPLMLWTVWWIMLAFLQALVGDLWRWINPFAGVAWLVGRAGRRNGIARLPEHFGMLPAIGLYLCFAIFYLADIAPDDPDRLAAVVSGYLAFTAAMMVIFGPDTWLERGEFVSVLMGLLARVAPLARREDGLRLGLWGHAIAHGRALPATLCLLILMIMATGSFDGINETFAWLGFIGVNPLEFPGRSAVWLSTVLGLLATMAVFVAVFAAAIRSGVWLAGETDRFGEAFRRQAPAILPIAAGYHLAHYLSVVLVNGQYVLEMLTHAFHEHGAQDEVTTGFLNATDTVRVLFLTQAGAVVAGHVIAIMAAHAIALSMFPSNRKALASQLPLIAVMIAFTLFGLWLLATPRGA
ncbi:hypothetical protein CSC94_04165 [Zhengella mangrovi]|uniref:Fenitrothion hydrolase n=1 Tax=Zhengella mangrovi TaxID=1982044 RepID=A0A2G1QQU7_9HYPH|nr:hypothetical protein [Zhengella mangrovi]PHP67883.1 hypothetical protein CSC94_04165 [Zhengella mangrovi]